MIRVLTKTILIVTAISTLFVSQMDAYCARCVKIEAERAKEQAANPKPVSYYDDQISLHSQNDLANENEDTSTNNSGVLRGSTYRSSTESKESSPSSKNSGHPSFDSSKDKESSNLNILAVNENEQQLNEDEFFEESSIPKVTDEDIELSKKESEAEGSSSKPTPYGLSVPSKIYSTIYAIFKTRNFLETLDGSFTLFIPSNEALQQLPSGTLMDLVRPENQEKLAILVSNHLVARKILRKDFTESHNLEIKAISGRNLTLSSKNGKLFIDDAEILRVDPAGYDGVIYLIDKVLVPH